VTNQWYCPACGPVENVEFEDGDLYTVCVECCENVEDAPPPFVTAMQDQIKNLQRVAIKAAFYFYLPHSDDAYDEVLEALDAAGYKRPDEDGYLGGGSDE